MRGVIAAAQTEGQTSGQSQHRESDDHRSRRNPAQPAQPGGDPRPRRGRDHPFDQPRGVAATMARKRVNVCVLPCHHPPYAQSPRVRRKVAQRIDVLSRFGYVTHTTAGGQPRP